MSEAEEQNNKPSNCQPAGSTGSFGSSVLGPGGQIGPFRIEQELGRGAMGVVYLAHDSKLDRSVAIKSLPAELLAHTTVRARFGREGRVLACLNHPNIATIYDELIEAEGVGYLVLEYVPGLTLAERIAVARVKPHEALSFAQQIAEAVAAAHEHGVIHRDLKPGNIKITPEGRIKVLDFGLAKAVGQKAPDREQSTVTQPGRLLGTPAYMSPEQVRGLEIDARCDIWAFGCVLYEMLTGKAPFEGGTASDTMAAILDREPDWNALPQATPANIQVLLRRCLAKDPRRRLHDIADAGIEISETLSGALEEFALPGEVASEPRFFRRDVILVALVCCLGGLLIAGVIWCFFLRPKLPIVSRLAILVPADKRLYAKYAPNNSLAISPDGKRLVYVGESDDGTHQLYQRSLDDLQIKPIPGTRNAHNPFFSPDGQWVGFFTMDKQLKRVSLAGRPPLPLYSPIADSHVAFGCWPEAKTIVFSDQKGSRGLWQISVDTGQAESLVVPDSENAEAYYCYPQALPKGKAILYSHVDPNSSRTSHIEAYLPKKREREIVLEDASYARYVKSGHLIFVRNKTLRAVPFDVKRLKPSGKEVRLVDDVEFDWTKETPQIAISDNGTTVYFSGSKLVKRELVWVDRQGNCESLPADANAYEGPRLSRNGQQIAVGIRSQEDRNIRVSVYDVELGMFTPLTTEGESCYQQWSPDETRIAFWGSVRGTEGKGVFCQVVGAGTPAKRLATEPYPQGYLHPYSWSQNLLACTAWHPNAQEDIWVVYTDAKQKPKPILATNDREYNPAFSPDGCLLAYVLEKASGQPQIYIREYPSAEPGWAVPTPGATNPVWSHDGNELFYIGGNGWMMAVKVTREPRIALGKTQPLFRLPDGIETGAAWLVRSYDVCHDGRFLMLKRGDVTEHQLIVVQNWFEELKRGREK